MQFVLLPFRQQARLPEDLSSISNIEAVFRKLEIDADLNAEPKVIDKKLLSYLECQELCLIGSYPSPAVDLPSHWN